MATRIMVKIHLASSRVSFAFSKSLEACGDCMPHRALVPWVPWAAGYSSKNLDMAWFPPVANDYETKYLVLDLAPPLLAKVDGPPT
jgi:hypothetical protein